MVYYKENGKGESLVSYNVKIFMCAHKAVDILPPLATAVQGGAAINPRIEGLLSDDGALGSISEKNREYCELTVQYYAWKNEECDSYGFCHYRRFFGFGSKSARPYLVFSTLSEKQRSRLLGQAEEIAALAKEYDVIVPRRERMGVTVREKYFDSEFCFEEDLDRFLELLGRMYPQLLPFAEEYMSGYEQYFCNMFIMKRQLFFDYSEKLFSLLEAFDEGKTLHGNFQADRTDGYLAERFLGIYILYLKSLGNSVYEVSRVDVGCSISKRITYKLLPPESRLRMFLKRQKTKKGKE
ncbi:MAG: DUF4422 domain-containing protein [Clostridia bacterium]|nr:DUF4422 domain-containing protein [Clostridia bacterium]